MGNPGDLLARCTFNKRSAFSPSSTVIYLFDDLCVLSIPVRTIIISD